MACLRGRNFKNLVQNSEKHFVTLFYEQSYNDSTLITCLVLRQIQNSVKMNCKVCNKDKASSHNYYGSNGICPSCRGFFMR